jgi:hypothetical protein
MDKTMALILCGVFARSNYGFGNPTVAEISRAKSDPPDTPRQSAEFFCAQFMESDEHEDMFAGEAEMWFDDLHGRSEDDCRRIWPDKFVLYDAA